MNEYRVTRNVDIGSAASLGLPPVDFRAMHEIILPYRLRQGVSKKIAFDLKDKAPIAIQTPEGLSYSYVYSEDRGVHIVPGVVDAAQLVIEMSAESWQNYYYELRTRFGLLYEEAVRFVRGNFEQWDDWEPALRCLYSGTPIYNPRTIDLRARDGSPLDLHKSFNPDDDPEDMSHFLRTAGYLHVRAAFSPEEIARLSEETDRLRSSAVEGDVFSRWAGDESGNKKVWDLHYMALQSDMMKALDDHPMIRFLSGLLNEELIPSYDRDNGTHAIIREFVDGETADSSYMLGWHKDCGLGGCPVTCPRIQVGIQLDAATPESSQLFFLAGSHGHGTHDQFTEAEWSNYPIVTFSTEPGDVTVHSGCILHAAPKANGPLRRRTIYTRFINPMSHDLLGRFETFDQVIPNMENFLSVEETAKKVENRAQ